MFNFTKPKRQVQNPQAVVYRKNVDLINATAKTLYYDSTFNRYYTYDFDKQEFIESEYSDNRTIVTVNDKIFKVGDKYWKYQYGLWYELIYFSTSKLPTLDESKYIINTLGSSYSLFLGNIIPPTFDTNSTNVFAGFADYFEEQLSKYGYDNYYVTRVEIPIMIKSSVGFIAFVLGYSGWWSTRSNVRTYVLNDIKIKINGTLYDFYKNFQSVNFIDTDLSFTKNYTFSKHHIEYSDDDLSLTIRPYGGTSSDIETFETSFPSTFTDDFMYEKFYPYLFNPTMLTYTGSTVDLEEELTIVNFQKDYYVRSYSFDYVTVGAIDVSEEQVLKGLITETESFEISYSDDNVRLKKEDILLINGKLYMVGDISKNVIRLPKPCTYYSTTVTKIK